VEPSRAPRGRRRQLIEAHPVGLPGALLRGTDAGFITGSDFLMDGGVTAAYRFGELAPK
jgi:hypothetical protein